MKSVLLQQSMCWRDLASSEQHLCREAAHPGNTAEEAVRCGRPGTTLSFEKSLAVQVQPELLESLRLHDQLRICCLAFGETNSKAIGPTQKGF